MEYKKSYLLLWVWLLLFVAAGAGLCFVPGLEEEMAVRIILNGMNAFIVLLMAIIYFAQTVYWINGVTFEEAKNAGSQRRKAFAGRHLYRFGMYALLYFLFSCMAAFFGWGLWLDIVVGTVGLIAAALSTMNIKL